MKKVTTLLIITLVLGLVLIHESRAAQRPLAVKVGKGAVKVNCLEGTAQVRTPTVAKWQDLKVGNILRGGDEVQVGKGGRLELLLPDHSVMRFAGGSIIRIDAAPDQESPDVDVHLAVGRSWAKVQAAVGIKRSFGISTENAVAGVRGTVYRVNAEEDKSAIVKVYEGEVEVRGAAPVPDEAQRIFGEKPVPVEGPKPVSGPRPISMEKWTVLLKAMQQVVIRPDGTAEPPRSFTMDEDRDEWVDWNRQRDQDITPQPWGKW